MTPRIPTVLVVDHDPPIVRLLEQFLRLSGFEVLTAMCPHQAIDLSRSSPREIDVLVTDVRLPGMTGPSLAATLCSDRPGLGVLFISAYPDYPQFLGPHSGFLAKPFLMGAFVAAVRRLAVQDAAAACG